MNTTVLSAYNNCLNIAMKEYEGKFRNLHEINTDTLDQNTVSYDVTTNVLNRIHELVVEKVAYIEREQLHDYEKKDYWFDEKFISKLNVKFDYRDKIEGNIQFVQPIPILVLTNKERTKILVAKKKVSSLGASSPEKDKMLVYFGGHIRVEDKTSDKLEQTIFNALGREILEELAISLNISSSTSEPLFLWFKDNDKSEKHLAICYFYQADFDHHKIKLDDYEFIQKKGTSDSGKILDLNKLGSEIFENWSKTILFELLGCETQLDLFHSQPIDPIQDKISYKVIHSQLIDNYYVWFDAKLNIDLNSFVKDFRERYCKRKKSNVNIVDSEKITFPSTELEPLFLEKAKDHIIAFYKFDSSDKTV